MRTKFVGSSTLFDSNAHQAIKTAQRRKYTLIGVVLLLIITLVLFIVTYEMKSSREKEIATQYAEIDSIYNQENLVYQQKQQEWNASHPSQANEMASSSIEPNYSVSMPKLRDFALQYPDNPYAWQAAIRSSTYFIMNNKLEEAQKELETILPYTSKHNLVQIKIRTALAGIYASQNNIVKAVEQLEIVEKLPSNPLPNQSRFLKAQILLASGNKVDAKKALDQIISEPPSAYLSASQENDIVHQAKVLLNKIGL